MAAFGHLLDADSDPGACAPVEASGWLDKDDGGAVGSRGITLDSDV